MGAYMTPTQIATQSERITAEFEKLLTNRRLVMRPKSKQWAFLRHCFSVALKGRSADFPCTHLQALQYRFEVDDKLGRYYLSPGRPLPFIFRFMHFSRALSLNLVEETYPSANGYVVLVTEDEHEVATLSEDVTDVLERVVTEGTDAEWTVYQRLPEVYLAPLERCFAVDASAYKRIKHLAERHSQRQWSITQPENNPSTKRVLDVKVVSIERGRASVRTKEYWYLRWWDVSKSDYINIEYRETNAQTYILVKHGSRWLIEDNIYPPPRNTTPHRKSIVIG